MTEQTVLPDDKCTNCLEDRVDWLVWSDDGQGDIIICATCGTEYTPYSAEQQPATVLASGAGWVVAEV